MNLQSMLGKLASDEEPTAEKTASTKVKEAKNAAIDNAIEQAMGSIGGGTKTASADPSAPVADLVKLAKEVSAADAESDVKQAKLMGAAMADGLVERLGQWGKAAEAADPDGGGDKTAAEEEALLEKYAQENPDEFKAAVEKGYADQMAVLEKQASEAYTTTFDKTTEWVHKTATEHFLEGFRAVTEALQDADE